LSLTVAGRGWQKMARFPLRVILFGVVTTSLLNADAATGPAAANVVEPVTFGGHPFPFGYAYGPGQCYTYVHEDTPRGPRWRRLWICTEPGVRGYRDGNRF
jgi:hypothetical protein